MKHGVTGAGWLWLALTATPAHADPNDYVHLPDVVAGERELDFKLGQQQRRDGGHDAAASLGLGIGVNEVWFTELYAKEARDAQGHTRFDATEWENRFQIGEKGRTPIDLGLLLEVERPTQRDQGYELTLGPLLQTQVARWQGNFNLLWRTHVRSTAPLADELRYEAQLRYRQGETLDWGAQALGSFGAVGSDAAGLSDGRSHRAGPACFGKWRFGAGAAVVWNAAVLFRVGAGSIGTTLRTQVELEL